MEPVRVTEPLCEVPKRIEFSMHAYAENVYLVRNLMRQARAAWGLSDDVYGDARLIITEFATNACRIYQGQVLKAWAANPAPRVLEVAVWDPDPFTPPTVRTPTEKECGRGLRLVEGCSTACGWYPSETTGGTVVWARLVW